MPNPESGLIEKEQKNALVEVDYPVIFTLTPDFSQIPDLSPISSVPGWQLMNQHPSRYRKKR